MQLLRFYEVDNFFFGGGEFKPDNFLDTALLLSFPEIK